MSTSSSEEVPAVAGHHITSSGLESTGSLLFSVPSDTSDVQTEITPPSSPASSGGKMRTPRDILDASRRLGQISVSVLQRDVMPTKPKQLHHRAPPKLVANDEAGYDADADGDGEGEGEERTRVGPGLTRPIRRSGFLRIDTRQHRRVASMLATRRPSSGFGDRDAHVNLSHPPLAKLAPLSALSLKPTTTADVIEYYELRRKLRAEPVGLGIGFPENHPLRGRAFTTPVPGTATPPINDWGLGLEEMQDRRSELLFPSGRPAWVKKPTEVQIEGVHAPSPLRLVLRPTFLELSPSPIEYLPPGGAGTVHCDDIHDRGARRAMGTFRHHAEIERAWNHVLAREGLPVLDLPESMVTLHASSDVTTTLHVGLSWSAL